MRAFCNFFLGIIPGIFIGLIWVAINVASSSAFASPGAVLPQNTETPRGLGLGLGVRASAVSTSALEYNPAGLPVARLYHIQALGSVDPNLGVYSAGGAVVDSSTTSIAAGLSLRGIFNGDKFGSYSGIDGRLGLGIAISERVSLGLSGRYLTLKQKVDLTAPMPPPDKLAQGITGDLALRVALSDGIQIALLGENLINLHSVYAPVMTGGSLSVQPIENLTIGADLLFDMTSYSSVQPMVGGGIEYFTGKVPFRLGYIYHHVANTQWITGGLGYVDEKIALDMSIRQQFNNGGDTLLLAGIAYFVQ